MKSDLRLASGPAALVRSGGESENGVPDALSLLTLLWRGKWWILLFSALAVAAGGFYVFSLAVPLYTAHSIAALQGQEDKVIDLESVVSGLTADQATINTQMGLIRSREMIGRLVQDLDLAQDPEFNTALRPADPFSIKSLTGRFFPPDPHLPASDARAFNATIDAVLERIRLSNVRESYIIEIYVQTTSPEKSARIANRLAELYVDDQLQLKINATTQAADWLSERVVDLKEELEAAEDRLSDFIATSQLISPEALAGLNVQMKDLRKRVSEKRNLAEQHSVRIANLEDALQSASPAELAALADDAAMEQIANQIEDGTATRSVLDSRAALLIDRLETARTRELQQIAALESSLDDLVETVRRQSAESVTLRQLEREVEANELIYESFLTRLKELSVQEGVHSPDVRVFSWAVPPQEASSPPKVPLLVLSLLLGVFTGAAYVLLRERFQKGFRTPEELERFTGLRVLGEIPKAPTSRRKKLLSHIVSNSASSFSEAVRSLRTSILLSNAEQPPKTLMITSAIPGEGKTTQSISLARNFALMGKKVLLIEADIRRRTFSLYFDVQPDRAGLVTAVTENLPFSETVLRRDDLSLDVLVGEKANVNAADFFSSDAFGDFIRRAAAAYDIVIIDAPPVLPVSDARIIGRFADATLCVVRWDKTARSQVAGALRMLRGANLNVAGLVLSQVDHKGMKRYGYSNYHSYKEYHGT